MATCWYVERSNRSWTGIGIHGSVHETVLDNISSDERQSKESKGKDGHKESDQQACIDRALRSVQKNENKIVFLTFSKGAQRNKD